MNSSQQPQTISTKLVLFLLHHSISIIIGGVVFCAAFGMMFAIRLLDTNAAELSSERLLRLGASFLVGVLVIIAGVILHEHQQQMRIERVVSYVEYLRQYTVESFDSLNASIGSSSSVDIPIPDAQVGDRSKDSDRPLGERERNTYLGILGVLCHMAGSGLRVRCCGPRVYVANPIRCGLTSVPRLRGRTCLMLTRP